SLTLLPETFFKSSGPRTWTPVRCCMLVSTYLPSGLGPMRQPMSVVPLAPAGLVTWSPLMPLLSLLALAAFFCCSAGVLPGGDEFCGVVAGCWVNAGMLMAAASVRR